MIISRGRGTCAVALIVGLALTAASSNARARLVTMRQAEQLALEYHPQLAAARDNVVAADAALRRARATNLPTASLTAGYTRNIELPVIVSDFGTFAIGDTNIYQMAVNVQQPLFLGFAGVTGTRLAETNRASADLSVDQARQAVVGGVREAYLGAVLARDIVRVQEQAVAQAESSLALVQRRYNVGAASRFDLLRAQVQVATIRPNSVTAQNNRQLADARLRLTIGLDPEEDVAPADTLRRFTSGWAGVSLDSLIALAMRNRLDVRQTDYAEQQALYGVTLATSSYYPMVSAFGRASWEGQSSDLIARADDYNRSVAAGLQLQWTVWDSWKTSANVQSARVGLRQVAHAKKSLRDAVAVEVESAYHSLRAAGLNVASGEQTVAQAAEALRLARVLYSEGGSLHLDVITAQTALTQAQTQYAQALYEYHIAHTRLERALGLIRLEG